GELKRELKVMKEAGIGGVEINSIAMPPHAVPTDAPALQWAGGEWCEMVKVTSEEARELGMITDLIVGSGWPFGGRFLEEEEIMQRLGVKKYELGPNEEIHVEMAEALKFETQHAPGSQMTQTTSDVELIAARLIPVGLNSLDEVIDLSPLVKDGQLNYRVGDQNYVLVFLYNEWNFKSVHHGSPGADGPIMDHYKQEVVRAYLDRLKVIERETGVPLSELIRALFCDSIELGGSNWTDDMASVFRERKGYDITPYLPFVVQPHNQPNTYETSEELADNLHRVQYDFYQVLIDVFLDRFTREFQDFCTENGVLCRYQAYGTPYYMGLFQGNLIPDIPESNNWIYSRARDEAESEAYSWNQGHGYMLWNKAASTGAHITGRKITSCEAMTNVQGVFRTSLETIKQSDDMNFITGINHTVLHGFNYSPPEAGFPGWIRYGAYFNEQNTWWKYFRNWADYNARLSAVFQHSDPVADVAVVGRMDDFWAEVGPTRPPFNTRPWYYARLWEPISNLGSSCDYLHTSMLEDSEAEGGKLICGNMAYSALILTDVRSLSPRAAEKISAFASAGGKIVFTGQLPERSLSLVDAENNDHRVQAHMQAALELGNVHLVPAPEESADLLVWTVSLFERMGLDPQVGIGQPISHLYTMSQTRGEQEIYFFVNSHRSEAIEFDVSFDTGNLIPYLWDPRSGERFALSHEKSNELRLKLDALESALVVFEPEKLDLPLYSSRAISVKRQPMEAVWEVKFEHVDGSVFTRKMEELIDFRTSADDAIRNFSGTVTYSTVIENSESQDYICLVDVNEGVSELRVNGESAGMKWYGNHIYEVGSLWKPGSNRIKIVLTTTLANYCGSLKENQTARAWTRSYETPVSSGLVGVEWGVP
ncbi:MAG: hypothetical protein KAI08_18940, partial [Bacteroidales bacterium]|nr:hypothetical protein [Bacteroidales bacterium]